MRLAHISDIHLRNFDNVAPHAFLSQRVLGAANLLLNRGPEFPDEVVDALFEDVETVQPDHLIVSGDVSNLSLPGEFERVRGRLLALSLPPSEITVVPGNHDSYTYLSALRDDFGRALGPFLSADLHPAGTRAYPFARVRDGVSIVALSSARASLPLFAIGTLGRDQLRLAEELLAHPRVRSSFRIVVLHHPPVSAHVKWHARLTDAEDFLAVVRRVGADLVLHGHLHRVCHEQIPGPTGAVKVVGTTASTWLSADPARRASYHVYEIDDGQLTSIQTRSYDTKLGRFHS